MTYKEKQEAYMEWLNANPPKRWGDHSAKCRELYQNRNVNR